MDKKLILGSAVAGVLLVLGASGTIAAQSTPMSPGLDEAGAVERALTEVPGTVQETELDREDGKLIYEIEILTADGLEMEVEIDAETGAVLKVEEDGADRDDKKSAGRG
ncbi:PepSY domain-containing protein [uncultured Roseibium sp.]|uniref:PepSY domain-containing protein n=1 Tax=uncultured Roseibium sp. TaxID=1936171 RepID=UPI0026172D3A|nr:PepSY domain-containing protein [uncultured Roseibium sp.]